MVKSQKSIVISGGTKGIGRAIAERFGEEGFTLCTCARTEADLEAMQSDWAGRFPQSRLLTFAADLSRKSEVQEFAAFVRGALPQVDVLVNNAGLFLPGGVCEVREGTLETLLEINLYSAYHLTRALLPLMLPQGRGHIFNVCSIASIEAMPGGGAYSISKFALLGFSKVLREELKAQGLRVTAVLPGSTWSDSWRGVDLPQERLVQAEDVAKVVWGAYGLSDSAVVEEVVVRPQLGDV